MRLNKRIITKLVVAIILIIYIFLQSNFINKNSVYEFNDIPSYSGKMYVYIDDNNPVFDEKYYSIKSFENYSELDILGRAGTAFAIVSKNTMPSEERSGIGQIKPSGWHTIKYDGINGEYLFNRCHLIGYQLAGENANEKNLITCTRQMNIDGMLYFENLIVNYINKTNNRVLYRVTPIFNEKNLLASGVIIEAYSIEDKGSGIKFEVFIYNVQDGIEIDYTNGDSKKAN